MPAKIESKLVSWLSPDPDQPRKTFDEDDLRTLGASLQKKQWYPLLVRSTGMILDGERRWRSAKLVGKDSLDVIILDESISRAEATELQLVTALHRAGLSAYEQACGFRDWLTNNPGKTAKELAQRIDRDQSLLGKYLGLFDCIPPVLEAAAAGRIGPSQWYPISLLPADQQPELFEMHLAGLPRDQIAELSRMKRINAVKAAGQAETAERTPRIRIPLAVATKEVSAHGVVTVAGIAGGEVDLDETEKLLQEALKAVRDARKRGLGIRAAQASWRDMATAGL